MLQIYKQNRAVFQKNALDAVKVGEFPPAPKAPKMSGTEEQRETLDASMAKLMKLKKDVTETILAGNGGEKMVQKMLNALGKDTGGIDGNLGTKSRKAISEVQAQAGLTPNGLIDGATAIALVKAFQREKGLSDDGVIGPITFAALNGYTTVNDNEPMVIMAPTDLGRESMNQSVDYKIFTRTLLKGMEGEDVRALQIALGIPANGKFGTGTEIKLKQFQDVAFGSSDGVAGNGTLKQLIDPRVKVAKLDSPAPNGYQNVDLYTKRELRDAVAVVKTLDKLVSAKDLTTYETLQKSIFDMKRNEMIGLDDVYLSFTRTPLAKKLNLTKINTPVEKEQVLSGLNNALMGTPKHVDLVRASGTNLGQMKALDTSSRLSTFTSIIAEESGISAAKINAARNSWYANASDNTPYKTDLDGNNFVDSVIGFSARAQGSVRGLEPVAGAKEVVDLPGADYQIISLSKSEKMSLKLLNAIPKAYLDEVANNMSNPIARALAGLFGRKSLDGEGVRELLKSGKLDFAVVFFKSGNCFNDAVGIQPKIPKRVQVAHQGSNNNRSDTVTGTGTGGEGNTQESRPGRTAPVGQPETPTPF